MIETPTTVNYWIPAYVAGRERDVRATLCFHSMAMAKKWFREKEATFKEGIQLNLFYKTFII